MGSKWGPIGLCTILDPYGTIPSPNGPMATQNKPYFTFLEGRFWTFPTALGDFSENGPKTGLIFFGTENPCWKFLQIHPGEILNGAMVDLFRPDELFGFLMVLGTRTRDHGQVPWRGFFVGL